MLHVDESVWTDILIKAELTDQHFLSPANYSDDITLRLIDMVAETLDISRADTLLLAGRNWCDFANSAGYGSLFSMAGKTLGDFLANLDRMHSSLNVALPEASMPSFDLIRSDAQGYEVVYRSKREGFAYFVEGIFQGLFEHYEEPMSMAWEMRADGAYFLLTHIKNKAVPPHRTDIPSHVIADIQAA